MLLVGGQVDANGPGGSQVANRLEQRVILLAVAPQPVIGESQRGALESETGRAASSACTREVRPVSTC